MTVNNLVNLVSPFIFTGTAIYLAFFLTKLNQKVKSQKVVYVWISISIMYSLLPLVGLIISILPYDSFILPILVMFVFARYYWNLNTMQAVIFSLAYGVLNVLSVLALAYLLKGVFSSSNPSPTI